MVDATRNLAVRVSSAGERAIRSGHPWIFDGAIESVSYDAPSGTLAVIFDRRRRFLAVGLYDPASPIRIRILHQGSSATIDQTWFEAKFATALTQRLPLIQTSDPARITDGFRLLYGENDGLPGLILDRYADTNVLKLYTPAWIPHLPALLPGLTQTENGPLAAVGPTQRLVLRLNRSTQNQVDLLNGLSDGQILHGPPLDGPVIFRENGLLFEAEPVAGQKTGFFLDQRENRAKVEELVAQERGRWDVLNVFAYTGGFSLYAARGGASRVVSLDISAPALAAAECNFALNQPDPRVAEARHEILAADAFTALAQMAESGRRFHMVIVDPPAFAKRQDEVERAMNAYTKLAHLALGVLRPGGTLVMASCSSRVTADMFFEAIHAAAQVARRPLQEIARTGHPLDHPVGFAEGAYLKCLFAVAA